MACVEGRQRDYRSLAGDCRSGIGGAVFSAGAGGSAGWAPAFCASASGRAGCGGTSDGLVPVVTGSAGAAGLVSAPGVDCRGGVACASCGSAALIWASESAVIARPATTSMAANAKSPRKLRFLLSDAMTFTREFVRDINDFCQAWFHAPPQRQGRNRRTRAGLVRGAHHPGRMAHTVLALQVADHRIQFIRIDCGRDKLCDDFQQIVAGLDDLDIRDRIVGVFQPLDQLVAHGGQGSAVTASLK